MPEVAETIRYLPEFLRDFHEFRAIAQINDVELNKLWQAISDFTSNQYVATATADGLARWESIIGIIPASDATLSERRLNLMVRVGKNAPYTKKGLSDYLNLVLGDAFVDMEISYSGHRIDITINLVEPGLERTVEESLRAMIPAATEIIMHLNKRNRYMDLNPFTYEYLSQYTYRELSNNETL